MSADSSFCSSSDAVVSSPWSMASAASRSSCRREVVTSLAGAATVVSPGTTINVCSGSSRRASARNSRSSTLALSARAAGSFCRHLVMVLTRALGASGTKLSIGRGWSPTICREM